MSGPDNPPAFPLNVPLGDGYVQPGMTLRDWFAGQAVSGLLANPTLRDDGDEHIAALVYALADAMLAEREKGKR